MKTVNRWKRPIGAGFRRNRVSRGVVDLARKTKAETRIRELESKATELKTKLGESVPRRDVQTLNAKLKELKGRLAESIPKADAEAVKGELQGKIARLEAKLAEPMRLCISIVLIMLLTAPLLTPYASAIYTVAEPEVSWVSGTISEDTTWSGDVYVTGVEVADGVTLTIEPGTTIRFKHWRHGYTDPEERVGALIVRGALTAIGTAENPIRFTSNAIDPQHGDWQGIIFQAPASNQNIIDHSIIEYANVGIMATDVNFTLSNSIVRWSLGGNVCFMRSSPIITHNRLYENGHGVIEMEGYSFPIITYNTIWGGRNGIFVSIDSHAIIRHNLIRDLRSPLADSNGILISSNSSAIIEYNTIIGVQYGISNFPETQASKITLRYNNIYDNAANIVQASAEDLVAKENWWGTTDKEQIKSKFGTIGGRVIYEPYLTSPIDIGKVAYDYENNETYENLPLSDKDAYLYMYPDDLTRKVIDSWYHGRGFPSGVAWDGQHLWVSTFAGPTPYEIRKFDLSGNLISSFSSPGPWPYGLAFDGQYLWCLDYAEARIYQMDTSGKVIKSIPAPGKNPIGLTFDGEYLWTIPWTGGDWKAYRLDTSGNVISSLRVPGCFGLAWDGEHLWVSSGQKFYEMDPSDGSVIRVITSSGDKSFDVTWQGPYIWSAEWGNEIEPETRVVKMLPMVERIIIDGLRDDWREFSPLISDQKDDAANEKTDIKAVYGFTDDKYFYLMIEPYAKSLGAFDHVDVEVDVDDDGEREYSLGSTPCRGTPSERQWGIGVGIADFRAEKVKHSYRRWAPGYLYANSNVKEVFEFKVPLHFIENITEFNIKPRFLDKSDGEWLVIDETDWVHIGSILVPPEEGKPTLTATPTPMPTIIAAYTPYMIVAAVVGVLIVAVSLATRKRRAQSNRGLRTLSPANIEKTVRSPSHTSELP